MAQSTAQSELPGRCLAVPQRQNLVRCAFHHLLRLNEGINCFFGMASVYAAVNIFRDLVSFSIQLLPPLIPVDIHGVFCVS